MPGPISLNVELTSRCNKCCWMCGRRQRDRELGVQDYGDMPWGTVSRIAEQTPPRTIVQLHNNGEPLLYPLFGQALQVFDHCYTSIVSNGKLLVERAKDIIGRLDLLSVSVIEGDTEAEEQLTVLKTFLKMKDQRKPFMVLRCVGQVPLERYETLHLLVARRVLHAPEASVHYHKPAVVPETGVCWDLLSRLSIDRYGNISPCVRFDPQQDLVLGNIQDMSLLEAWNGPKRLWILSMHVQGKRSAVPYCGTKCDYYGIPIA